MMCFCVAIYVSCCYTSLHAVINLFKFEVEIMKTVTVYLPRNLSPLILNSVNDLLEDEQFHNPNFSGVVFSVERDEFLHIDSDGSYEYIQLYRGIAHIISGE